MRMYKVIGADQQEYGPLAADQIRQWIGDGRLHGQTRAQSDGSGEWKTLSDFSEFSAALEARAAMSPPAFAETGNSEALAAQILARDYHLAIGSCFSRGWQLVQRHFWLTVCASFLIVLISIVIELIPILGWIGGLVFSFVFWGGLDWMFLKLIRGEKSGLGDAFAGFSMGFVQLMLASLVSQLLMSVGLLLLILPGIYLLVAWFLFTPLLVIDKRLEFWPAMELSRKVVTRHWWQFFGFLLLQLLVLLAGLLALGIGVFIALPIVIAASIYAYEDIFGRPVAPAV